MRDRPTKAHEYVFLLSKSERYFWDARRGGEESPQNSETGNRARERIYSPAIRTTACGQTAGNGRLGTVMQPAAILRSVWTITPKPFKGAHFATFPPALVERCIKAGTSEHGCCPQCGKAWERVTETHREAWHCPRNYGGSD